jgi:putative membrane protein
MGTADVVPGVSGGTMAVALGIYWRLLAAISSLNVEAIRALLKFDVKRALGIVHWRFLGCLGFGIALAIIVMVRIVKLPHLIESQPQNVYAVFFGLVLASTLVLARRIPKWRLSEVLVMTLSIAVGFAIVNIVPVSTPDSAAFLFASGCIAICAMLLPGISGSFILLILGKYSYVLSAVEGLMRFDLAQLKVVVPFALGCLTGLTLFSRFLGWLMRRWHDTVLAGLGGLLLGSLWRIWPYQHLKQELVRGKMKVVEAHAYVPDSFDVGVLALIVTGFLVVVVIEFVATQRRIAR